MRDKWIKVSENLYDTYINLDHISSISVSNSASNQGALKMSTVKMTNGDVYIISEDTLQFLLNRGFNT